MKELIEEIKKIELKIKDALPLEQLFLNHYELIPALIKLGKLTYDKETK